MEKTYIIANWKMNPASAKEAQNLFDAVVQGVQGVENVEVVVCPPAIYLYNILNTKYNLHAGAQDCAFADPTGAHTGEISPTMLKNAGCEYVILGHSERKKYAGETLEIINKKLHAALAANLTPVVCIGEATRGENAAELEVQLQQVLAGISVAQVQRTILVYEPEWAISTNKNAQAATPEDCTKSIAIMGTILGKLYGDVAIPILYGGSTHSSNIQQFLKAGAHGALVGGASLDAAEFTQLVKTAAS
jgi:triosephosphate isomerase (TIM)